MDRKTRKIFRSKYGWIILLLLLAIVNYLASDFHARLDLTKEKRYTLSKPTRELLANLDEDVQIDVFLKGDFPAGFRKLANSTTEFLRLLKDRTGKIKYRFISPLDEMPGSRSVYADSLVSMGAVPINLTVQKKEGQSSNIIFPVALITYKGKQSLINLLAGASRNISQPELNTAEALLEYRFLQTIDKLMLTRKPGIGYLTGNGEPMDERTFKLRTALEDDYDFRRLNLENQPRVPDGIDLLLLVKPELAFTENNKLKIDQFIMNGGKLLAFIDNLYAEMDSMAYKPETIAYDRNLNLTDLFFRYGLRINTDLIMDLRCEVSLVQVGGTLEAPQYEYLPWNYFALGSTPENSKLRTEGYIGFRFANSIDSIQTANVVKTPLLVTSPNSRTISTPALISLNENKTLPNHELFSKNAIPIAMLLEGQFTSLFNNRISEAQRQRLDSTGKPFRKNSETNKIIVVADGDMVFNEYVQIDQNGNIDPGALPTPLEMGWNRFTYIENLQQSEAGKYFIPVSNNTFFLNCVEYLISNPSISQVREKEILLRLLNSPRVNAQRTKWQVINIALPIFLVVLLGFGYQQLRKRKYAA